jgi:hypothetical protein
MELISVHVPKTAGTSFWKVLEQIYGKENIYADYSDKPLDPASPFNSNYGKWAKFYKNQIKAIKYS